MHPASVSITVAAAVAIGGAGLSVVGTFAYLNGIRRGATVPHRGSWLVWSAIALLAAVAHGAAGGRWSLVVLGVQAVTTVTVLGFSVRAGVGGITVGNAVLLSVAGVGIVGWLVLDEPIAATACAALADGAGLVAIVPKIWREPHSETASTYAAAGLSGLLAALAALVVTSTDPALLLFPVYFCLANAATARLIVWRRRAIGRIPPTRERVSLWL